MNFRTVVPGIKWGISFRPEEILTPFFVAMATNWASSDEVNFETHCRAKNQI